jgi:hypothetical protein
VVTPKLPTGVFFDRPGVKIKIFGL